MKKVIFTYLLPLAALTFFNGCAGADNNAPHAGNDDRFDCPHRPNCVSSEARDADRAIAPFQLKTDISAGWKAVQTLVEGLPRTAILEASEVYLHAACRSRVFRFVDDLQLRLNPQTGEVAVRSASRTGYWDFGVNRRRVESLRRSLKENGLIR